MEQRRGREVQAPRDRRGSARETDIRPPGALLCLQRKKPPEGGFLSVKKCAEDTKPRQSRGFLPYDQFQFSSSARR